MRMKMIALLLGSASLALGTAACDRGAKDPQIEASASNPSGIDLKAMDKAVRPGDDFFAYANGNWVKTAEIPADRSSIGAFYITQQSLEKRMDGLFAALTKGDAKAGSNEGLIANYASAFSDQAGIDQRALPALKADIARFQAIADKRALAAAIGSTVRADVDPLNATDLHTENLFGIFVTSSLTDPSKNVPYLLQGGLGLPERDYYLSSTPEMAKIRDTYRPFIAKMLTSAGLDNGEVRAKRVYDLEAKIAAAQATIVETEDASKVQSWRQADFAAKAPGLDWPAFFQAAQLSTVPTIAVWHDARPAGTPRAVLNAARLGSSSVVTMKRPLARICSVHASQQPQPGSRRTAIGTGRATASAQPVRPATRTADPAAPSTARRDCE